MPLTAIDLFAGAGGMSLGLQNAGIKIALAVDNWQLAVDTYTKNFDHFALCRDLSSMSGAEVLHAAGLEGRTPDLVVGGPPCQGFSIQRIGVDIDSRNDLVLEYARLICEMAPRAFIMENVTGLLGKRGRVIAGEFIRKMGSEGYSTSVFLIDASDFGLPQRRQRAVFVGFAEETPYILPAKSEKRVSVWDAIGDLPAPDKPGTVGGADPLHVESRLSPANLERMKLIPPGGGFEDLPVEMRVNAHKAGAGKIGHRGVYGRLRPDAPSSTITARFDSFTRGRFAHPYEHRNITLREGARLQTFPDSFTFLGNREEIAAQIGNAVPPLLAQKLGESLIEHLT